MKIEIQDLEIRYDHRPVLSIPELTLAEGKIYAIVGPNGSGKTTLLKALNLLLAPSRGKILFDGIEAGSEEARTSIRRRMTLLHQNPLLFSESVFRNVAYGLKLRKQSREAIRARVSEALRTAELEHLGPRSALQLSGGESQRIALARTLALDSEVLLLDEPTANVDRAHTGKIEDLIKKQRDSFGRTVIIATHTPHQAHRLSDETLFLLDGRITGLTPENLFSARVETKGEQKFLRFTPALKIPVETGREGEIQVSVNPVGLEIVTQPPAPTPGGSMPGKITRAALENDKVILTVSGELEISVTVPRETFSRLGVNLGSDVAVIIGPSALKIH